MKLRVTAESIFGIERANILCFPLFFYLLLFVGIFLRLWSQTALNVYAETVCLDQNENMKFSMILTLYAINWMEWTRPIFTKIDRTKNGEENGLNQPKTGFTLLSLTFDKKENWSHKLYKRNLIKLESWLI